MSLTTRLRDSLVGCYALEYTATDQPAGRTGGVAKESRRACGPIAMQRRARQTQR
jgi:hypothetical protein